MIGTLAIMRLGFIFMKNYITDSQLTQVARVGGVRSLRVAPTTKEHSKKGFILYVLLTYQDQELTFVSTNTQRPRIWANLDTLYTQIENKYGSIMSCTMLLRAKDPFEKTSTNLAGHSTE